MKEILLTQGKVAFVDDQDFDEVSKLRWFAVWDGYNWYAQTNVGHWRTRRKVKMHVMLMKPPVGVEIDHWDSNGLNNQRRNLRICSHAENCRNRRRHASNKSGFKGVSWKKRNRKWCAQIKLGPKVIHLGLFDDPAIAARVYDAAAQKHFGEFALTNDKLGRFASVVAD